MAQLVEHILGKDEVPSSNLGSSSRKPPTNRSGILVFLELLSDSNRVSSLCDEVQFAYPDRRSTSSLVRRRERVYSPSANTWVWLDINQSLCSRTPPTNRVGALVFWSCYPIRTRFRRFATKSSSHTPTNSVMLLTEHSR